MVKIVATRCHVLMLKCTKFDFDWGSAPDPAGEAHVQYSPSPPSWIEGDPTSKRGKGREDGLGRGGRMG